MKTFLYIVLHLFPVRAFMSLKETHKETWLWFGKTILSILAPIIIAFAFFNILLLAGSFILWKLPNEFYIPFYGGHNQMIVDRILIAIGIMFTIFKKQL
jgi:hypothetical protein